MVTSSWPPWMERSRPLGPAALDKMLDKWLRGASQKKETAAGGCARVNGHNPFDGGKHKIKMGGLCTHVVRGLYLLIFMNLNREKRLLGATPETRKKAHPKTRYFTGGDVRR